MNENPDLELWDKSMALFDRLIDSDPEAVAGLLTAEPDVRVREAAERLWHHHKLAGTERFLEGTIEINVPPVFVPKQVLLNRFEITKPLGAGGMGEVYLAYDRKLGEPVAIKTIAWMLAASPQIRRRFIAEVQNARRIPHPNVCRIHELFDFDDTVFFVMEYVDGISLNEYTEGRNLSKGETREIVLQLAEGLHAAHRSGVVHGDFKSSNILIVPGTPLRAVIMDFGLARALRAGGEDAHSGESLEAGTPDYMAPELLTGSPPTVASDVFAFGKVARQIMPNSTLWDGCTKEHPGERPTSLDSVIRELRRDPTRRYWLAGGAISIVSATSYALFRPVAPLLRIEAGARVLVNGFQAVEGATAVARLTRSLLITALQQSPQLRTIADQELMPALRRLSPGKSFPVEGEVLQRLIVTQRASHWVEGVLTQSNGRMSLALSVWRTSDRQLHAQTAFGDVPAASALAARTAEWIRLLAGESRRSLEQNPSAVGTYTSEVPEALQKYYEAMERYSLGEMELAIPLLEETVRLDPHFAQAESARGMCLLSQQRHLEALECAERGRQLAAALPERERAWTEAFYQEMVMDPVRMVEATRINLDYHPDEPRFYRTYGQMLCRTGRAPESIPFMEKAVELSPQNELLRNELTLALCEAGRFEEGLKLAERSKAASNNPYLGRGMGLSLMGLGRYGEACTTYETVLEDSRLLEAGARIMNGEVESAVAALSQEAAARRVNANPASEHRVHEFLCGAYFLTDQIDLAREQVRAMLPLPECPSLGPQLGVTAFWAGRVGDDETLARAREHAERVSARWHNGFTGAILLQVRAIESRRRQEIKRAESLLLESMGSAFTIWVLFELADLFGATARPEMAEEYWKKFEDRQGIVLRRWFTGAMLYGQLHRGMAARMRRDRQTASACAAKVLQHWGRRQPGVRMVQIANQLAAA